MSGPWKPYLRDGQIEARPYVPGEALDGVSVQPGDAQRIAIMRAQGLDPRGMIVRSPQNHADQRYVNQRHFDAYYRSPAVEQAPSGNAEPQLETGEPVSPGNPVSDWTNAAIRDWLEARDVFPPTSATKARLLELVENALAENVPAEE